VFFSIQICCVLGPPLSDYLCNRNCYFHSNVLTTSENLTRSTLSPLSFNNLFTYWDQKQACGRRGYRNLYAVQISAGTSNTWRKDSFLPESLLHIAGC
jgi:hypothetical protein